MVRIESMSHLAHPVPGAGAARREALLKEGHPIAWLSFYSNTGYHAKDLFAGPHIRPLRG